MISRKAAAIGGSVLLLASAGLYYGLSRPEAPSAALPPPAPRPAIAAVPKGATAVVTFDLKELRASPLAAPYLAGERTIEGLGRIRDACGFVPLTMVNELVLAVPEAFDAEFGMAATGTFGDGPVVDCATKVIGARGGKPVSSSVGSFRTVRDVESPSSGEIAVRPGGPLLFGGGGYLRAMIDAVDGSLAALEGGDPHLALRAELEGHDTITVTIVLSKKQREVVAQELAAAGGAAPAPIGAVASAAAGLSLQGNTTKLRVVVACDDPASAASLLALAEEAKRNAAASKPALLLGAEPLLARLSVEARGPSLIASVDASVEEIETIIDRAMKVRALLEAQRAMPAPDVPPPPSASAPAAPSAAPTASARPR
jgi:hypothetical protein